MIQKKVTKKIGRNIEVFMVEGKNLHQVVMAEKNLSFGDVDECGICHKDYLVLNARITPKEGYEFVEIKCLSCKGALVFGRNKKNPDSFYLRRNDDKTYKWIAFSPEQDNAIETHVTKQETEK